MSEKLTPAAAIPRVEEFWDLPNGYFFKLREGTYESGGAERVEAVLRSIAVSGESELPRRLVSLTWMIPTFMEWQVERVGERGGDVEALRRDIARLRNAVNELLGAP
jgi:hypothetical protein